MKSKQMWECSDCLLSDQFPSFIWQTDADGRCDYVNATWLEFRGRRFEQELGLGWLEGVHPEDVAIVLERWNQALDEQQEFSIEYRIQDRERVYRWIHVLGKPFSDPRGRLLGYFGSAYNISHQKEIEEQLRLSEEQYRRLVEYSPEGLMIHDGDEILFVNSAAVRIMRGSGPEDLIGRKISNVIHPDYLGLLEQRVQRAKVLGLSNPLVEEKFIRCDGSVCEVEVLSTPFVYEGQMALQAVFYDVSKRNQEEEEYLKSSKLESLGLLAGGIAHDFNNILTIILGNVSLARLFGKIDGGTSEILGEIEKAAIDARDLTYQLLTLAKGGAPIKKVVSLGKLVLDAVAFALHGSNVRPDFDIPEHLWTVEVDEGQINQVINNLVINAQQAMPDGGVLKVVAENVLCAPESVDSSWIRIGQRFVRVSFHDSGTGIAEEVLTKIFDPYFTTKEKGNGLGLATANAIIRKHNGNLRAESECGKGATFTIYLPASFDALPAEGKEEILTRGTGRILVMDDEEKIRQITWQILNHLGYEAEFVADGQEMVERYLGAQDSGRPFAAVVVDLTVPGGVGGKEGIKRLLEIDPDVKALVSSGYAEDPVLAEYSAYGFKGSVAKPYRISELSRVLSEVLCGA